MIRQSLSLMQSGWQALISNKSLWLAVCIGIVVPLLFLVLTHSMFSATHANIATIQKATISSLHNTVANTVLSSPNDFIAISNLLSAITTDQSEIIDLTITQAVGAGSAKVIASTNAPSIGTMASTSNLERAALTDPGQSFIFEFVTADGDRVWKVYRALELAPGVLYFLSSEHNFSTVDSRLDARTQSTYLVLVVIILLLLVFVYFATKQIDYERKYKQSLIQLQEQDVFMGAVVHELRAPLTAIRGYASNIEETTEAATETRQQGAQIKSAASRLVGLVGDYLNIVHLRSGKEEVVLTTVPLVATLKSTVSELLPSAIEKKLRLILTTPGVEVSLMSNQKFLSQIFTNLISNAIKYTAEGKIEVVLATTSKEIEIRIKDTGYGMSADDQKRLFAPFARVGDARQVATITGSGLGMWLTKLMVEKLGGTIMVESIKDVGTHVVVRFKK